MKKSILSSILVLTLAAQLACPAATEIFVQDDFNDESINTDLWSIQRPFGSSAVVETNGVLKMEGRGGLLANAIFTEPTTVSGRFKLVSNREILRFVVRTRGTHQNPSGEYDDGYAFTLSNHDTPYVRASIERIVPPTVITIAAQADSGISTGEFNDFKVEDNITNLVFYVKNMETPLLQIDTSESFGNRIGFYNREGGQRSELDSIQIGARTSLRIYTAAELEFFAKSGVTYQVQRTDNFQTWTDYELPVVGNGTFMNKFVSIRTNKFQYFRVIPVGGTE